jgi:type VI secretion system protein ImpH
MQALESEPHRFDLFQALRRLECAFRDRPRLGEALRPADEPVRLGQEPSLAFADRAIASFARGGPGPPRLSTFCFGVFGPNGPLPLHLTEYVRDRLRNSGDATLARFLDVFHHRMLTLFYRAFADAEPAIARDRPASDTFALFVGALFGMGLPSTRGRTLVPDRTKLHYAGLLSPQTRNADGLAALVGDLFRVAARVEPFVGEWVDVPRRHRSRLGRANCLLGVDALLGTRAWLCTGKFRLVLGPLGRERFERFLPGSADLAELASAVRAYAGDELTWDLQLVLARREWRPAALGRSRLGWDSWLGPDPSTWDRAELVLDPRRLGPARDGRRPAPDEPRQPPQLNDEREQAHV